MPQSVFFGQIVSQTTCGDERKVKQLYTMVDSLIKKSEEKLTPWQTFVLNFVFFQYVQLETIRVKLIEQPIKRLE